MKLLISIIFFVFISFQLSAQSAKNSQTSHRDSSRIILGSDLKNKDLEQVKTIPNNNLITRDTLNRTTISNELKNKKILKPKQ